MLGAGVTHSVHAPYHAPPFPPVPPSPPAAPRASINTKPSSPRLNTCVTPLYVTARAQQQQQYHTRTSGHTTQHVKRQAPLTPHPPPSSSLPAPPPSPPPSPTSISAPPTLECLAAARQDQCGVRRRATGPSVRSMVTRGAVTPGCSGGALILLAEPSAGAATFLAILSLSS